MECARNIQDDQLHLLVRAYGTPDSNQGNQFGVSELYLTSAQVTDISTQATIQRTSALGCPSNSAGAHGQALLFGPFYKGGGGTVADDVRGYFQFDRYSTDALGGVEVGGYLSYQGQFFGNIDLGPVNVGERVSVELKWDQPNHRFIARLTRPTFNSFAKQYMPYSISDTLPAVAPFKAISARAFPVNCVGTRSSAEMSVSFGHVMTN